MPMLNDGETAEIKGSAKDPYILKNTGGVFSCSCPAWRNQSNSIEKRTCKHLRQFLGDEFETERIGGELPERSKTRTKTASSTPGKATTSDGESAETESLAPGLLLAHSWEGDIDLQGWWMSEKLDGVRAYWDGERFTSRQGNVYMAPDWFIEALPKDVHLDGELWLGRKMFQRAVSIVRRQDKNSDWKEIKFVVFDAPKIDDIFEARIAYIQQLLDELRSNYALPHTHIRCVNENHLREELARVEALGGEGLMLRKPASKYEVGRSATLLKVKSFHDAEAKVIEHLPGIGKHKGRMGALSVELSNGIGFSIGTGFSDAERENPPAIGSIITFRYQELTDRGVPRFPSFVRKRADLGALPNTEIPSTTIPQASGIPDEPKQKVSSLANENIATTGKSSAKVDSQNAAKHDKPQNPANNNEAKLDSGTIGKWRSFEFSEDGSNKFWMITINDDEVTVKYGRIGTSGQEKAKQFPTADAAAAYAKKIIIEKTDKGYQEITKESKHSEEEEDDDAADVFEDDE